MWLNYWKKIKKPIINCVRILIVALIIIWTLPKFGFFVKKNFWIKINKEILKEFVTPPINWLKEVLKITSLNGEIILYAIIIELLMNIGYYGITKSISKFAAQQNIPFNLDEIKINEQINEKDKEKNESNFTNKEKQSAILTIIKITGRVIFNFLGYYYLNAMFLDEDKGLLESILKDTKKRDYFLYELSYLWWFVPLSLAWFVEDIIVKNVIPLITIKTEEKETTLQKLKKYLKSYQWVPTLIFSFFYGSLVWLFKESTSISNIAGFFSYSTFWGGYLFLISKIIVRIFIKIIAEITRCITVVKKPVEQ